jgi:hypothetical protein
MNPNVERAAVLIPSLAFILLRVPPQEQTAPPPAAASAPATTPAATFTQEQLEQMVAPVALYPDSLMLQIVMAATYPLEVVEADRWMVRNPGLTGPALEEALKQHDWDPSVKSLCGFPTVLKQMSDNLDWTRDLGDAFLDQKDQLLDTVQSMRQKAVAAGNLKTTDQQKIVQDGDVVAIEPVNPEVIYVPSYSPLVVYGPGWYYPYWYYPYYYVPPGPGFGFVTFGFGFAWGFGLWGGCDWHHHFVHVDVVHYNNFNVHTNAHPERFNVVRSNGGRAGWTHDPEHRKGVGYRSGGVAQQFGARSGRVRVTREQARGFDPSRTHSGAAPSDPARKMASPASPGPGGQRSVPPAVPPADGGARRAPPAAPPSGAGAPRSAPPRPAAPPPSSRPRGGLSGYRNPGFDRSAAARGAASRGGSFSRLKGRP